MANAQAIRRQRGFTLLELLITLSVTTIGLIGLLSLHLSVARGNDGASRSAEAQQISATQLEKLRAMSISQLANTFTPPATNLVLPAPPTSLQISSQVPGRGGMAYTVTSTLTQSAASTTLFRIRVVTQWAEEGGTVGSNGGLLDHQLALEVIRTREDEL